MLLRHSPTPPTQSRPQSRQTEVSLIEAEETLADKEWCRNIVNSELIVFYGCEVDGYLPPLPQKEKEKTHSAPVWFCDNPAMRQLANIRRRGPRTVLPGRVFPRKPILLTPELRRPHTAVETRVKTILSTRTTDRPQTSGGKIESYTFRLSQPPKDEPELIKPKKVKVLDMDKDVDTISIASSVPGRFRTPRFIKPGPKKKISKRHRTAAHQLLANQRAETISRVLMGDIKELPQIVPTKVAIYISATTQDFIAEREILQQDAYPQLREYCARQGLELEIVDFTCSSGESVDITQRLEQLKRCRNESYGPCFVTLVGDYSGPVVLPAILPEDDFDLFSYVADHHNMKGAELLSQFYFEDSNADPSVYLLQKEQVNGPNYEKFCKLFTQICIVAEHTGKITENTREYYELKSATETEIKKAIFEHKDTAAISALAFIRKFKDFSSNDGIAHIYTNMNDDNSINDNAAERRENLVQRLKFRLQEDVNAKIYEVPWDKNGIYKEELDIPVSHEHVAYLRQFSQDFVSSVKRLIEINKQRWELGHPNEAVFNEVLLHSHISAQNNKVFAARKNILDQVKAYLQVSKDIQSTPLILHGEEGCGRTAIVSSLLTFCKNWLGDSTNVVIRYCGISDKSSNITDLLVYLCLQICAIYNMEPPRSSDRGSVNKMIQHFQLLLELISTHLSSKRPLVIILDDIDKISDKDRSDSLAWLPKLCYPNIYIIVTLNSQSQILLESLEHRLQTQNNLISVNCPSANETLSIVITYVKNNDRKLNSDQVRCLANMCKKYPNLAFVSSMCQIALQWCSWTFVDDELLPTNTEDALIKLKYSLMHSFGEAISDRILCYLTLLKNGISETELRDLLSSDERIIEEMLNELSKEEITFVIAKLAGKVTKVIHELKPLLVERFMHGKTLQSFAHSSFRDMLFSWFFDDVEEELAALEPLTFYQENVYNLLQKEEPTKIEVLHNNKSIMIDCQTTPQLLIPCNLHKLNLVPNLISDFLAHDSALSTLKETCMCNFKWLLVKIQALSPKDVLYDFQCIEERNREIDLVSDFIQVANRALLLDPLTLPCQLLGCMPCLTVKDYPLINKMLEDCLKYLDETMLAVFIPLFPVFPSPLDACKSKLWGIVDILCMDESDKIAVIKNDNGYIDIWDIENKELAFSTGAKFNKTTPNTYCSGGRLMNLEWPNVSVWDILTGALVYKIDVGAQLGGLVSSVFVLCYDKQFELIVIHTSDEDFNQTVDIINLVTGKVMHRIKHFDVKDEFFRNAAFFTSDKQWLVFVNARSQLMDDGKTTDAVQLNIISMETGKVEKEVKCGEKKFHSLLQKNDGKFIISWKDCSFDVYDAELGSHSCHIAAPDSRLVMHQCFITEDGYLVALSSTDHSKRKSNQYYACWFWITEDQSQGTLLSQAYKDENEIPHHFLIIEELHIALLATPETANVTVWDLPNSECVASIRAHTELLERVVRSSDPYRFYTCSSGEEVVKLWDIYDVIKSSKDSKQKIKRIGSSSTSTVPSRPSSHSSNFDSGILKRPGSRSRNTNIAPKSVRFAEEDHFEGDESLIPAEPVVEEIPVAKSQADISQSDDTNTGIRNSSMTTTQLKQCKYVSSVEFSKDSLFLVSGSDVSPPVVWKCSNGYLSQMMRPFDATDISTPWVSIGVEETMIVGLTLDSIAKDSYPRMYKYQVWRIEDGSPLFIEQDVFRATACSLMHDRERSVLACFEKDKIGQEILFNIIQIKTNEVIHSISFETQAIPTEMMIADDSLYAVTNDVPEDNGKNQSTIVFKVGKDQDDEEEDEDDEKEEPVAKKYEFRVGTKYREYRSTKCVLMSNGMAISSGLNGDMQMWDIASCEYEGNLYFDPTVKDTRDPDLHNYSGKKVTHLAVSENGSYLICGISDGSASLWDLENDALCYTYTGHSLEVCQVAISADNQLVLTSSRDLSLCVWQFATPDRPLARLYIYAAPTILKISRDKRTVVAVGARKNEPPRMMMFNLRNTFTD